MVKMYYLCSIWTYESGSGDSRNLDYSFFHRAEKLATGEKDKYILNLYWFFLVRGIEAQFQLG